MSQPSTLPIDCPVPLRIGDPAPRFIARSTQGRFDLGEMSGRWVMLFSHPADFTPVCSTEFVALASAQAEFTALNCVLVGLSVDSLFSHLAWLRLLRDATGIEVSFPIIEDTALDISRAYGMVAADARTTAGVRNTYVIDPDSIVRAVSCYPVTVGRSVDEMLRLLRALQQSDADGGLTPVDWQPGQPLLRQPATSLEAVMSSAGPADWFMAPLVDRAPGKSSDES